MSRKKEFDTIQIEFTSLCKGNVALEDNVSIVHKELIVTESIKTDSKANSLSNVHKVFHGTRALDSSFRTFLEIYHATPAQKSLGTYLTRLTRSGYGYTPLNASLKARLQTDVVDKRNKFLHSAGAYPNKKETEAMVETICSAIHTLLTLGNI